VLFDQQDERLGYGQRLDDRWLRGRCRLNCSPSHPGSHQCHNTQRRIWERACLVAPSTDARCLSTPTLYAPESCCTAIEKRGNPPHFTTRSIFHKERLNDDSDALHLVQREKEKEMEILIDLLAGFDEFDAQNNVKPSQGSHGYNIAAMHDL
jgi:hypothetical protein